jgi:bifunctional oligoribonuclease and PAP phosphatase NrnA
MMPDMSTDDISPLIKEKAPLILAEIKKASRILLHCHPSPDPDSVGSALAMKFALEAMGKKATVIRGDSNIPKDFMHFPGAKDIVKKNLSEVDLAEFDLFIILDSGGTNQVSRMKSPSFPLPIRTVVIDHHVSNPGFADVNLIETKYPAVAQILFDLFAIWEVPMTGDMAKDLFIGIYTDTGEFKYANTTARTFSIAAELTKLAPDFVDLISEMENNNAPTFIAFQALALDSMETFCDEALAISVIPNAKIREKGIPPDDVRPDAVVPILRSVAKWKIVATMTEIEPNKIRLNLRSKDDKYDVSKLAVALGGGGHKMASGVRMSMPLSEAKSLVVSKAKELYNL